MMVNSVSVTMSNGYAEEDCENLSIQATTDNSIQIFIENSASTATAGEELPPDDDGDGSGGPSEVAYEMQAFHVEADNVVPKVAFLLIITTD